MSDGGRKLVSVVIPCYNQARYLGEAIESVLAQGYGRAEVIVVDDGSTDGTAEVAARYPAVRCVRQENSGRPAVARNRGLRESRGEYIVFLDADDRLLPGALEAGARLLDESPECAFVAGRCRAMSPEGIPLAAVSASPAETDFYSALLRKNYIWTPGSVMFRRSAVEGVGGFDTDEGKKGAEDYDLYLRITGRSHARFHDAVVLEYRDHGDSLSKNAGRMLKSTLTVLRAQHKFVKGSRERREAYKSGERFWQEFYGDGVVGGVRRSLREPGGRRRALRGVLLLLRYCPRLLARHAGRKLYCLLFRVKTDGAGA